MDQCKQYTGCQPDASSEGIQTHAEPLTCEIMWGAMSCRVKSVDSGVGCHAESGARGRGERLSEETEITTSERVLELDEGNETIRWGLGPCEG